MGMILRIASSRIVGQGDIVGRSGYFSLNLSANSVMRGRLDARRTLKSLVADLRTDRNWRGLCEETDYWREKALYYKHRYELAEFEAIRTLLLDTWCAIEPDQLGLNILSDDYCFLCIVKEDLSCLNV